MQDDKSRDTSRDTTFDATRATARWIAPALGYFLLAIGLGVAMAASHDFRLKGLHVHLNLLGWVSMTLMGVIYRLFPRAAASRLATWHYVLYQAMLPVMMVGLGGILLGHLAMEPLVAAGSVGVAAAVLLFALAVGQSLRRPGRGTRAESAVRLDQVQPVA